MRVDLSVDVEWWEVAVTLLVFLAGWAGRAWYDRHLSRQEGVEYQAGFSHGLEESGAPNAPPW